MDYHFIEWNDGFSVGIPEVDKQHLKLIEILNHYHTLRREKKDIKMLKEVLQQLKEYVSYHFYEEEEQFIKYNYPDIDIHRSMHRSFIAKIGEFQQDFEHKNYSVSDKIYCFLKDWLVNHILGADKLFSEYLSKHTAYHKRK